MNRVNNFNKMQNQTTIPSTYIQLFVLQCKDKCRCRTMISKRNTELTSGKYRFNSIIGLKFVRRPQL